MQIILKHQAVELGLKKYFTGKPCKQGHISERYTQKSTCCECLRLSSIKNIDKKRESDKRRYHAMSDEKRESERKRLREYNAKQYWVDPEKVRERARNWQRENRDKHLDKLNKWKSENQDKIKNYRQLPHVMQKARFFASRRRAFKERAIPLWADLEKIEEIYATLPKGMHVDHIVPLVSKYVCGLHVEHNLRHLDATENHSKGNHHWPDMWE